MLDLENRREEYLALSDEDRMAAALHTARAVVVSSKLVVAPGGGEDEGEYFEAPLRMPLAKSVEGRVSKADKTASKAETILRNSKLAKSTAASMLSSGSKKLTGTRFRVSLSVEKGPKSVSLRSKEDFTVRPARPARRKK